MGKVINPVLLGCCICLFQLKPLFAADDIFKNIETLMLKDAYAQAAKECEQIVAGRRQERTKTKAHYLLGICLLKEGKFAHAREHFDLILRRYARSEYNDDAKLAIADSYLLEGNTQRANQEYEQFLKDCARSELASLARMHLEQGKNAQAYNNSSFSVQLGCFSNKDNAEGLCKKLNKMGYDAYLLQLPGEKLYRVRVGKFDNRLQAEFLEQELKQRGFSTRVCP